MAHYSITLNFFLPRHIVKKLKRIKLAGNLGFDYRNSEFCHCTVKAILQCEKLPLEDVLNDWVAKSKKIFNKQKPFRVKIKNVSAFPTAIFANAYSEELENIHKKLFKVLPSSQPQFENKNYVPHATISLLIEEAKIISKINEDFGEFQVEEIQLMIWNKDIKKSRIYHKFNLAGN